MKIIKRLSLISTITQRQAMAKPYDGLFVRKALKMFAQKQMTVQQQLIKYGYTSKPLYKPYRLFAIVVGASLGILIHLYLTAIYKNQIRVRNKYRIQQVQNSSVNLRFRRILLRFSEVIEKNLFSVEFFFNNKSKKIQEPSEKLVRTLQYRNYMKNKDRKFQFMDIGVMERYPFPDISETQ